MLKSSDSRGRVSTGAEEDLELYASTLCNESVKNCGNKLLFNALCESSNF